MILSDTQILEEIKAGTILIEPFDIKNLGSNSYDIHLGKWLATYKDHELDAKKHNEIEYIEINSLDSLTTIQSNLFSSFSVEEIYITDNILNILINICYFFI